MRRILDFILNMEAARWRAAWPAFIVVIVSAAATTAAAQGRYWRPNQIPYCAFETPRTQCDDRTLALLHEKLGVATAEDLAAEDYRGVRIFVVDDFGHIMPAVSYLTRPVNDVRREGVAETRIVHPDGHRAVLSRPTWETGWREVDEIIVAVRDRPPPEPEPEPPATPSSGPAPIPPRCLHPSYRIIEVIADGGVERVATRTCRPDAAERAAWRVFDLVAAAFPHCGHFPIERVGAGAGRLYACLRTGGDAPLAAVEVLEVLRPGPQGDSRVAYEPERQADDVELRMHDGRSAVGRDGVVQAFADGVLGDRWLRILRAEGRGDTVVVRAELLARPLNAPDPVAVVQTWRRGVDGAWRIAQWRLEGPTD